MEYEQNGTALDNFMTAEYLQKYAKENDFIDAYRTSAKTGYNIIDGFSLLIREVLQQGISAAYNKSDHSNLDLTNYLE